MNIKLDINIVYKLIGFQLVKSRIILVIKKFMNYIYKMEDIAHQSLIINFHT